MNIDKANALRYSCSYCGAKHTSGNIQKHEKSCKSNPNNQKDCPVCGKKHTKGGVTCSYGCSNTLFRSGEKHPNWKQDSYRSTCFLFHKKECVVCGEINIVEVHHQDGNKKNNNPINLIPLCPTHHQYWHSKFRSLIENQVIGYIEKNKFLEH